ncbi:MAG: hypothetical protein INR73_19810 [Williamsia sp.]|nr:hypothetical protein [Williamsia sp.]
MSTAHLNEEQLQDYALTGITHPADREHLSVCNHCQVQLRAYQMLYNQIQEAETPLVDLETKDLIPDQLTNFNSDDRKESRYLSGIFFGAVVLLIAVTLVCWNSISWVFAGITPLSIIIGLLLLSGVLIMQLTEVYSTYRKKLSALYMELTAT